MSERRTDKEILDEINSLEGFDWGEEQRNGVPEPPPIPIEALVDLGAEPICTNCGDPLEEEYYLLQDDETERGYHICCEGCARDMVETWANEAQVYAKQHCRIKGRLVKFDEGYRYACSPEQYDLGDKESYTENSVRCSNRHGPCTNYDELIEPLNRDSLRDQARYNAITSV